MPVINNGESAIIVWGDANTTFTASPINVGTSKAYQLVDDGQGGTKVLSSRAGRPTDLNKVTTLSQWAGYYVRAIGAAITIPDTALGFGNEPAQGENPNAGTIESANSFDSGRTVEVPLFGGTPPYSNPSTAGWSVSDARGVMPVTDVKIISGAAVLALPFPVFAPAIVSYNNALGTITDSAGVKPNSATNITIANAPTAPAIHYAESQRTPIPVNIHTNNYDNTTGLTLSGTATANGNLNLQSTGTLSNAVTASGFVPIPGNFTARFRARVNAYTTITNTAVDASLGLRISYGPFRVMFRVEADGYHAQQMHDANWSLIKSATPGNDWHNYRITVNDGFASLWVDEVFITSWNLGASGTASQIAWFTQASAGSSSNVDIDYLTIDGGYPDSIAQGAEVYTINRSGFNSIHTPDIVAVNNTTLIAFWRDQLSNKVDLGDILYSRSTDGGTTWGAAQTLYAADATWEYANIVVHKETNGDIYAFVGRVPTADPDATTQRMVCKRSIDGGITWNDFALTLNYTETTVLGGKILKRGSLYLLPFHRSDQTTNGVLSSTDLATWSLRGLINNNDRFYGEGYLVPVQGSATDIMMICRDHWKLRQTGIDIGKAGYSISSDDGATWTTAQPFDPLPNYNVKGMVISDSAGQLIALYNARKDFLYPSGTTDRNTLKYKIKPSANRNWSFGDIAADFDSTDQYANAVEISPGILAVVWRNGNNTVRVRQLNIGAYVAPFSKPLFERSRLYLSALDSASVQRTGNTVTRWIDQSYSESDAIVEWGSPQYNATGLNGRPAIIFSGTDGLRALNAPWVGNNASVRRTIFVVAQCSNATAFRVLLANRNASATTGQDSLLAVNSSATNVRWLTGTGTNQGDRTDTAVTNSNIFLLTLTFSATSSSAGSKTVRVNGTQVSSASYTSKTNAVPLLGIGCNPNTAGLGVEGWVGAIGEVAWFERHLTTPELEAIETDIKTRWGIA